MDRVAEESWCQSLDEIKALQIDKCATVVFSIPLGSIE